MPSDYDRGVAAERARVRRLVSRRAAFWASEAGVSIDALESWIARGMPEDEMPRGKKRSGWMMQIAAAFVGMLDEIDSGREAPDAE